MNGGTNVYGLVGDHGSVLRIPTFSPDEVLYRVPKYQQGAPPPPEPPIPGATVLDELLSGLSAAGGPGVLGLAALGTNGSRRRATAAVLVVGLLASAGCVGNKSAIQDGSAVEGPGMGGSASSYIVPDAENETGVTTSGQGSVYGTVSDPDGLPVNGAFAALLGTPLSAGTDSYGRFHFRGLAAGPYRLHVDRTGFFAFETTVVVEANSITKVDVTLAFTNPEDVDHRPHRHNYWFDQAGRPAESLVLLDEAFDIGVDSNGDAGRIFALPPPLTIVPGTVDIEVNVTWTGNDAGRMGAVTARPDDIYNSTSLYPRGPGVPFHLRTTWEMTDPGHAAFSYWGAWFGSGLLLCNAAAQLQNRVGGNPPCPTNFHVKLTIHKGVLPLEPAHPDLWAGAMERPVVTKEDRPLHSRCYQYQGIHLCPVSWDPLQSNCLIPYLAAEPFKPNPCRIEPLSERVYNSSWQPQGFVPFETQWLSASVHASRGVTGSASDAPWQLWYRTAESPNYGGCEDVVKANKDASRPAVFASKASAVDWTWRIPVDPQTADPPYAKYSNWCFFVAPTDQNAQLVDEQANAGELPTFTLSVAAHKDPMPGA